MTKWFVYIFAIVIFSLTASASKQPPSSQSAGTVLFHGKPCWQHEDVVLLSMRQLMQNLVPTNMLNVDNDSFVTALMDYFEMSVQVVEEMSSGKPKDMLLLALCDAIGGLLPDFLCSPYKPQRRIMLLKNRPVWHFHACYPFSGLTNRKFSIYLREHHYVAKCMGFGSFKTKLVTQWLKDVFPRKIEC